MLARSTGESWRAKALAGHMVAGSTVFARALLRTAITKRAGWATVCAGITLATNPLLTRASTRAITRTISRKIFRKISRTISCAIEQAPKPAGLTKALASDVVAFES